MDAGDVTDRDCYYRLFFAYGTPNCTSLSIASPDMGPPQYNSRWVWPMALYCPNADMTINGQVTIGGVMVKSFTTTGSRSWLYYYPTGNGKITLITRW